MSKRGQPSLPRDARGWRIPRPNTATRIVYDMLVQNEQRKVEGLPLFSGADIQVAAGLKAVTTCRVVMWKIRNPEKYLALQRIYNSGPAARNIRQRWRAEHQKKTSAYVRKLMREGGYSLADAVAEERRQNEKQARA